MAVRRIEYLFWRVFLKMCLFVLRLFPAARNDSFFGRLFLTGAAIGIIIYIWQSPLSPTPLGILTWICFMLLAAINFAGYAAMLLFIGVATLQTYQSLRLFGLLSFRRALRTAKLFRHAKAARTVWWQAVLSLVLLALFYSIGWRFGFHYVAGIACFALVHFGMLGLISLQPPSVLFLAASNSRVLGIINKLRVRCATLRIVVLLDRRFGATKDDRDSMYFDNFRSRDDAVWRDMVLALKEMVRIIIIDTDAATEGVLYEIGSAVRTRKMDKVLFIEGEAGACPALEAAYKHELVSRDLSVHIIGESTLVSEVWRRVHQKNLPQDNTAFGFRVTTVGEILGSNFGVEYDKLGIAGSQKEVELATLKSIIEDNIRNGKVVEAEPHLRLGLEIALAKHAAPEDTAWFMINLAEVLQQLGNLEDSASFFEQALVIQEQLNPRGFMMAVLCNNYAQVLYDKLNTNDALQFMQRAYQIMNLEFGPEDEHTRMFKSAFNEMLKASKWRRSFYKKVVIFSILLSVIGLSIWHRYLWYFGLPLIIIGALACIVSLKRLQIFHRNIVT